MKRSALMGISLNDVNEEVENKYAPFVVADVPGGDVSLLPVLRLPKPDLHRLQELTKTLGSAKKKQDTQAMLDAAYETIRVLAVGEDGDRLLEAIDQDLSKLMHILEAYSEAMDLGEASHSDS